jgi:hypothetical protein
VSVSTYAGRLEAQEGCASAALARSVSHTNINNLDNPAILKSINSHTLTGIFLLTVLWENGGRGM